MVKEIRTVLIGLGNVNLGFLNILVEKENWIAKNYGIKFSIVGIADSTGIAINENGFAYTMLLKHKNNKGKINQLKEFLPNPAVTICVLVKADLLIEASPVNLVAGNSGIQLIKNALAKGWAVVLANKGPLVLEFDTLIQTAKQNKAMFYYSATVCGGLPVINVLRRDLKCASPKKISGIFNATTNFVLQELLNGSTIDSAIKEAQRIGAAETDPSLDLSGQDAANKLYIIMKSFTDFNGDIRDIKMQGIENITRDQLVKALENNATIKLIAAAHFTENEWHLSVQPTQVLKNSFLGSSTGWEMGIEVETDLYESMSMKIYEPTPTGTSAAVLRDAIEAVARR